MATQAPSPALPYARDLRGYGPQPPHARWPGDARIAVQFVLNYEEGGENNVLHGDPTSRDLPVRAGHRAGLREPPHDHGVDVRVRLARRRVAHPARVRAARPAAHGVWRRHGAGALPRAAEGLHGAGHEIANHGLRWIHYQNLPEATERRHGGVATHLLKELTGGAWPAGWYTGRDSPNTRRLVADQGGYEYDSDYYGDDLPFWMQVQKTDGSAGAAPGRALLAGHQRHALRAGAGLQHRRPLLQLPARQLRRAVCRGRRRARR